jgi:hypothetical protein
MPADDPVTLGELSRRFDAMEHRFEAEFSKLGRSIDSLRFVHLDQYRAEREALTHRIEEIEGDVAEIRDDRRWQQRMIVMAVVTSVVLPLILTAIRIGAIGGGG